MNNHDTPSHGLKSKTIKSVIRNKVNEWLASIEDEDLRKLCQKEAIVTGGCIASMLLGEEVNERKERRHRWHLVARDVEHHAAGGIVRPILDHALRHRIVATGTAELGKRLPRIENASGVCADDVNPVLIQIHTIRLRLSDFRIGGLPNT